MGIRWQESRQTFGKTEKENNMLTTQKCPLSKRTGELDKEATREDWFANSIREIRGGS